VSAPDVLVIGGGVNGLVCAAYLAKAGVKPLVLEAQTMIGGCARTEEIAPGFKAPVLAHSAGPLRRDVIDHLDLRRHGLEFVTNEISVAALGPDRQPVLLYEDVKRTAQTLREGFAARRRRVAAIRLVARRAWTRHRVAVYDDAAVGGQSRRPRSLGGAEDAARVSIAREG
jgi:phytoene dehydrogenase-like protein